MIHKPSSLSSQKHQLNSLALHYDSDMGLNILDQTQLPQQESWIRLLNLNQMIEAIQELRVRGAPLIGLSASLFLAHFAKSHSVTDVQLAYTALRAARPTAVNLMSNLDYCWEVYQQAQASPLALEKAAIQLFHSEEKKSEKMAQYGASLIADGYRVLTYCNTGQLATAGVGTALGAISMAHQQGKSIFVYTSETRPLGQGARLTFWELQKNNIPCQLICDNMAATLMQQKKIDLVMVGADRITQNGDVANKIGTYSLAVLCHYHKIPFYVVAPTTSFDFDMSSGSQIQIEQRTPSEVTRFWNFTNDKIYNPGFDVTPSELVTSIISENGIHSGSFTKLLRNKKSKDTV